MKKKEEIKGRLMYVYKGSLYLEMPKGVITGKYEYDEEENITYVNCKKESYLYETICAIIMIACVICNLFVIKDNVVKVRYNSVINYYNGQLYVNITNDESNKKELYYELYNESNILIDSGSLSPGDCKISIPVESPDVNYRIDFYYESFLGKKKESAKITVINRDVF